MTLSDYSIKVKVKNSCKQSLIKPKMLKLTTGALSSQVDLSNDISYPNYF